MNRLRNLSKKTLIVLSAIAFLATPASAVLLPVLEERAYSQAVPNGDVTVPDLHGFNTPFNASYGVGDDELDGFQTCIGTFQEQPSSPALIQELEEAGIDTSYLRSLPGGQQTVSMIVWTSSSRNSPPDHRIINGSYQDSATDTCSSISPLAPTGPTTWEGPQLTATHSGDEYSANLQYELRVTEEYEDEDVVLSWGTLTYYNFITSGDSNGCSWEGRDSIGPIRAGNDYLSLRAAMEACQRDQTNFYVQGEPGDASEGRTGISAHSPQWIDAATIENARGEIFRMPRWAETPVQTQATGDRCTSEREEGCEFWSLYFLHETPIEERAHQVWGGPNAGCENPIPVLNREYHPSAQHPCEIAGQQPHCVPFIAVMQNINVSTTDSGIPDTSSFNSRVNALGDAGFIYYDYRDDCSYRGHSGGNFRTLSLLTPENARIWFYRSDEHQALTTVFASWAADGNEREFAGRYTHDDAGVYFGPDGSCLGEARVFEASSGDTGPHATDWIFHTRCDPHTPAGPETKVLTLGGDAGEAGYARINDMPPPSELPDGEVERVGCSYEFFNPLTWMICPIIDMSRGLIEWLDSGINSMLTINAFSGDVEDGGLGEEAVSAFHGAWAVFRTIALAILVIAALIMVIAQAAGIEILDAYTIRKILPRLLIAAIGITLSWQLALLAITISNDLGQGVRAIIYMPFAQNEAIHGTIGGGTTAILTLIAGGAIAAFGLLALLTFVLTGAIAVLIAFGLLAFREIAVIALTIVAPIAIACAILPNTQKVWDIWRKTYIMLLAAFVIIMAFIATGRVFSATVITAGDASGDFWGAFMQIIGLLAYFAPYFMIPFIFKMTGGLMGAVGNFASQGFKRVNAPVQKFRQEQGGKFRQRTAEGDTWLSRVPGVASAHNRIKTADRGGFSLSARGRAEYARERQFQLNEHSRKALETEGGQAAAGDDDATDIARNATGRTDFLSRYEPEAHNRAMTHHQNSLQTTLARQYEQQGYDKQNAQEMAQQEAHQQTETIKQNIEQRRQQIIAAEKIDANDEAGMARAARRARSEVTPAGIAQRAKQQALDDLATLERGFGARMGSEQMRHTAERARQGSDTAFNPRQQQQAAAGGQSASGKGGPVPTGQPNTGGQPDASGAQPEQPAQTTPETETPPTAQPGLRGGVSNVGRGRRPGGGGADR